MCIFFHIVQFFPHCSSTFVQLYNGLQLPLLPRCLFYELRCLKSLFPWLLDELPTYLVLFSYMHVNLPTKPEAGILTESASVADFSRRNSFACGLDTSSVSMLFLHRLKNPLIIDSNRQSIYSSTNFGLMTRPHSDDRISVINSIPKSELNQYHS